VATAGRSTESAATGRKVTQRGFRTIQWRAEDVNGDDLTYDILYRLEKEPAFRPLRTDLDDPIVAWDTTTVPSGRYVLRIVASDRKANPDGRGLTFERDTEPIDVDHVPPTIDATASGLSLRIRVTDAMSAIRRVEWAPEAGTWSEAVPLDGLADSRDETFDVKPEAPAPAAVVLRAIDSFGNVSSLRVPLGR
jgi:hypothetical protein